MVETIDLGRDLEAEIHKGIRLSKRATVFLSCASVDRATADAIRRALMRHEFTVPSPEHFGASAQPIRPEVGEHTRPGCGGVRPRTPHKAHRPMFGRFRAPRFFREGAKNRTRGACAPIRSNVVPVIIAPFVREALSPQLANIQWFDLTTGPFEARVEELIRSLKTREME